MLTGENPFIFKGMPQKIRIVSNGMGYGPCPEPNDIVEQHITINSDGRVWFSAYSFGDGFDKYKKAKTKNYKIEKAATLKKMHLCLWKKQSILFVNVRMMILNYQRRK